MKRVELVLEMTNEISRVNTLLREYEWTLSSLNESEGRNEEKRDESDERRRETLSHSDLFRFVCHWLLRQHRPLCTLTQERKRSADWILQKATLWLMGGGGN